MTSGVCPLVRGVRRLPRVLDATEVELLMSAFRTDRDRAMAQAMLLGGLRRCEVLGLRLKDLRVGEKQLFIADGKCGHQRQIPISPTFFSTVADYLNEERPPTRGPTTCLLLSKGRTGDSPCPRRDWTRCSAPHGPGPDWFMGPATSCATPASPV